MLFEKVNKEHILQAIKDFQEKGLPNEFGTSSTYDLVYEGKTYPPKAIMAYANYYAENTPVQNNFGGGLGSDCFNAYERNGFKIEKKKNAMIDYKEYEKQVYNWLNTKNSKDPNFTFSLRQNGSKGAELDYFIGTEKSRYFAVTFWTLPVGFPGSSGDCIGLVFKLSADYTKYSYDFKLSQTNSPHDAQNTSALNLIRSSTDFITVSIGTKYISEANNKMYTIRTKPKKESYTDLNAMLKDVGEDLFKLIPIINNQIEEEKKVNPKFEAHRVSKDEFANMKSKLEVRFEKYGEKNIDNMETRFENFLNNSLSKGTVKTYLSAIRSIEKLAIKEELEVISIYDFETSTNFRTFWSNLKDNKSFVNTNVKHHNRFSSALLKYDEFLKFNLGESIQEKTECTPSLNQILYGPPGTGKTYYLKDQLFDKYTLKENAVTKEKYFEEIVANLTWWQVITLALIEIGTAKVNDIIENRWVAKKAALSESKNVRATLWGTLQMHTIIESENVAYKQRQNPLIFDKTNNKTWQLLKDEVKDQSPEIYDILKDINDFETSPQKEIKNYNFVTFHQSFSYEDFIEGIKPISPEEGEENTNLGYKIENGVFKELCIRAKNDPENRYAIFIDEINRGNISAIFGELITLIETDKRKGAKNQLSIKLPYSKKEFSVPLNLDIYGTMNTADRSVEALDTALRRRFEFKEIMPKPNLLKIQIEGINLKELLETINKRIEVLLDRDHTIGHSYFIKLEENDILGLKNTFKNNIIPLLQEYFYGNYEKIGLVLGKGFFNEKALSFDKDIFASFDTQNYPEKGKIFNLKTIDEDFDIIKAINILLKKEKEIIKATEDE